MGHIQDNRPNNMEISNSSDQTFISRKQNNIKFQPEKCVVISSSQAENIRSLKQDTIRHVFSKQLGPIMIDNITPYKFQSENPKYMIQLSNTEDGKSHK